MKKIKSNYLAETSNLSHHSLLKLIKTYEKDLKEFGTLETKIEKTGGRNALIYSLNENQLKYIILLMKNSEVTNKLKKQIIQGEDMFKLVEGFYENKHKEGCVYIIQKENKLVKIGVSINPEKRIEAIKTHGAEKFMNTYISEKTKNYKRFERELHSLFKKERVMGEWFNIDFEIAKQALESKFNIFI